MKRSGAWFFVVAAGMVVTLSAQSPMPAFEVASIKRNVSGPPFLPILQILPGGVFTATSQLLVRLIAFAYSVEDFRLVGGPGWIRDARFDVSARASADVPNDQVRLMVQSLLRDRFALITHKERREMPLYTLVLARDDGRLGPGLQRLQSEDDCKTLRQKLAANTYYTCGAISGAASIASMMLGAPVVEKTGITGTFSVSIQFSPEGVRPFVGEAFTPPGDPNLPSFRDALRDQLGLKLESGRGPVDVLVIDSVQQPTEN